VLPNPQHPPAIPLQLGCGLHVPGSVPGHLRVPIVCVGGRPPIARRTAVPVTAIDKQKHPLFPERKIGLPANIGWVQSPPPNSPPDQTGSEQAKGEVRYSPAEVASVEIVPVLGEPDPERICTSIVERQNLTIRMHMRRLARLTNAFSKKWEHLWAAYCLHFAYYNFCRIHSYGGADHGSCVGSGGTDGIVESENTSHKTSPISSSNGSPSNSMKNSPTYTLTHGLEYLFNALFRHYP